MAIEEEEKRRGLRIFFGVRFFYCCVRLNVRGDLNFFLVDPLALILFGRDVKSD